MLSHQTLSTLHALKLFGMAHSLPDRLASPPHADLSHAEFVGLLVQDEQSYRDNQRLKRLLRNARLKQTATLEDLDYAHPRGLAKQVILELSTAQWITAPRHVLLTGPTGVGKSYVACALGHLAARAGYPVLYVRAPLLFETLQQARGEGSHLKLLSKLSRFRVLILDDLLLTPLTAPERKDLLEIIEDRCGSAATVITSQCPLKDWPQQIGDPTLADAICDRLLHTAYKLELKGESIRKIRREPGSDQKS
jgi:DNA replication protein DnaC